MVIAQTNLTLPRKNINKCISFDIKQISDFSKPEIPLFSEEQDIFPPSDEGLYVEESVYWDMYYEDDFYKYEWNNGILEVKEMPTILSGFYARFFVNLIEQFFSVNPVGDLIITDIGFTILTPDKKIIRRPDFAIILKSNPVQPALSDRSYKGIYDICIEFLSDSKKKYVTKDTVNKKQEYSDASVKEYYIIDANKTYTAFYRLQNNGIYESIPLDNGIMRSTVMQGFQFRVNDIYECPDFKTLINDDIYKDYILLDYQKQCKKAEEERKAKELALKEVEKERTAKEQALKELAQLKLLIKKMGQTE